MTNDMHTRAMLVNLSISAWSAAKFDRAISKEVADNHGATQDAGRYTKTLMPKAKGEKNAYLALGQFIANLRVVNYAQTLPWSDTGWRLLPVKNYTAYSDLMRTAQHEFDSLLDALVTEYPALCATVKQLSNGMVTDDELPRDIRGRYTFSIDYAPVPVGTDFRVTLAQSEIDIIAARTEERVKAAFDSAMKNGKDGAVDRLERVLSAIVDKCSSPDAIFRDSLIGNARDLCDILTRLNVSDNSALETFRSQTELLASTEPQTIRDFPDVRQETAKQAQSILDSITATFGPRN